ncbi:DUF2231 domain-containing protein [Nocardioides sp. CFH 31398]|uniref:DUF2231 domain-containing protein n=1 Tax=Nocardioides sp. CFH 31398 TaxID=2919579 RepID=UPI001F066371|nr:DUF2231 domain-containing protein [Nocardioides sp. CFH 31398]MCH1866597.1 hypothetical protein [Nocardioides sp. CFH 31398]
MEIAGLPAHALVVHAAVVLTPLAALLAVPYAAVARWRWALRWPLLGLAVVAGLSIVLAWFTGGSYLDANPSLEQVPAVSTHAARADVMLWVGLAFAVVAVAAALVLGGPTGLASGRGGREVRSVAVDRGLAVVLVVAALAALVLVVLTGDAGARAVWGG